MGIFDEENYIERKINVNGKEITARYSPESGRFAFGKTTKLGYTSTTPTNAGAFETIKALVEGFRDVNPRKICFSASGVTKEKHK